MGIQYQIIEQATPPVKAKKVKEPKGRRDKYGFNAIPVGGAAKFEGEGVSAKAIRAAAYQKARKNPELKFQVEEIDGAVFVYRLVVEDNGGAPEASGDGGTVFQDAAE